jgi:hypothetical protein
MNPMYDATGSNGKEGPTGDWPLKNYLLLYGKD